jgi:lysophospholipase L1-like esterase
VVFGDSVVLSGIDQLKDALGEVSIDAEIGRLPSEIAERIELRRKEQRLGNDIVIHMGTNGPIAREDLEPILQELADRRRVVIVNVKVPRKWMSASNKMINELVPLYSNVRLADWATTAKGRRGYFAPDGVHLTRTGARAFAALIDETLAAP